MSERAKGRLSLVEWLRERLDNCQLIAAKQIKGGNRSGWLEDAAYFQEAIIAVSNRDELITFVRAVTAANDNTLVLHEASEQLTALSEKADALLARLDPKPQEGANG